MARIVFSDIDGTLLTDDKRVTEKTEQAVKGLVQQGIPFVLVSARMPEAIYPITEAMGVKIPLISYSGALVLTEEGETLYSLTMKAERQPSSRQSRCTSPRRPSTTTPAITGTSRTRATRASPWR